MRRSGNCGQRRCRLDDKRFLYEDIAYLTHSTGICRVPVRWSAAAGQTPEMGMDVATPKAFVQNPLRGAVAGGAQCYLPWAVCPCLCKGDSPPQAADCGSDPAQGGHVTGAAFLLYGCVGYPSMEMQSAASEAEQPSATALLLLPEGWGWLQDQLGGCPVPSPE